MAGINKSKMSCDLPCMSYMALYMISLHIVHTNSRTSTHWKLNVDTGKVQTATAAAGTDETSSDSMEDPLMSILTKKIPLNNGGWKLEAEQTCAEDCQKHTDEKNESVSSIDNHVSQPETQGKR